MCPPHHFHTKIVTRIGFPRTGFTTIEVLFALAIVSIALLALEGTTTRTIQRVADSHRESLAADLARTQVDRLIASRCRTGSGTDSVNNVVVQWTARASAGVPPVISIEQHLRYPIAVGLHSESLAAVIPCH